MYRIPIAEDNLGIVAAMKKHIEAWGLEAMCVEDFQNVFTTLSEHNPYLILLGISLPSFNGYHWCSEIRKVSGVPIAFISSVPENMNIVMTTNMGDDDFIAKSSDLTVSMAKIQAILCRIHDSSGQVSVLEHRGALLNTADTALTYQGERIDLTKNDYRILQALMERKGQVVSHEKLMERLRKTDSFVDENILTVNMTRLRKELDAASLTYLITTKVGTGYLVEQTIGKGQTMRVWSRYFRAYTKRIVVYFLFCAIFLLTFASYDLPLVVVLYPVATCTVSGLAILILDLVFFAARHKEPLALYSEVIVTVKRLPHAKSLLEEDYQQIILSLFREKMDLENWMESRYTDLIEYYTVWVHQIKTPIASMHLSLQEDGSSLSRELMEELQSIEQCVDMVLCYLRLDPFSTDYLIRGCDPDTILQQAMRKFASQFIHCEIKLVYEPTGFSVLMDEKWLLFALEQLLSNTIKHTEGRGTASITMNEPDILRISGTGTDITPEDLPRTFEKGYAGYNGRGDKKASGIGLYLCYRICGNLRHHITARSVLGNGTAVYLDLNRTELKWEQCFWQRLLKL